MINRDTNDVDYQTHSDRSQHQVVGEKTGTVERASNAIAGLDAINQILMKDKVVIFQSIHSHLIQSMSQQVSSIRELGYISQTSLLRKDFIFLGIAGNLF